MDRAVWTSAVIGFLTPIMLFQPYQSAGAWFSSWMPASKPGVAASKDRSAPSRRDQGHGPRSYEYDDAGERWDRSVGRWSEGRERRARDRSALRVRVIRSKSDARRRDRPRAPALAAVRMIDPKEQLSRTMDPAKQPDWYLTDPTIKKGDVLFLNNRVVVFKGVKVGDIKDYVPVSRTRLLTKRERRWIEKLAAQSAPQPEPRTNVASAATAIKAN